MFLILGLLLDGCTCRAPERECIPNSALRTLPTVTENMNVVFRNAAGRVLGCPDATNQADPWSKGYLFDVETVDCPRDPAKSCAESRPETVRFAPAGTPLGLLVPDPPPGVLGKYCLYLSESRALPELDADETCENDVVRAPPVLESAATVAESSAIIAQVREARVRENLGWCPVEAPGKASTAKPVRLVLLDTAPTNGGSTSPSYHGEELAEVLGSLCDRADDRSCANVNVVQRIALPLHGGGAAPRWDIPGGGSIGSRDWLAQAIFREVLAWQRATEQNEGYRLVLNLSLGWHGVYGGAQARRARLDEELADVDAVFDALRYARCSGALIIAAAGNRQIPSSSFFPAAWHEVRLTPEVCDEVLTGQVSVRPAPAAERLTNRPVAWPLLYMVGGLAHGEVPLPTGAADLSPELWAYAQHVSVGSIGHAMTGSSVSAAVVAGDAARRWSVLDIEDPDAVMASVRAAAKPIDVKGSEALRVASCGNSGGIAPVPIWPAACPDCQLGTAISRDQAEIVPDVPPWLRSTPEGTKCELCGLDLPPPSQALIDLDDGFTDPVTGAILTVRDASNVTHSYTLPTWTPGGAAQIFTLPNTPCDAATAWLDFEYDSEPYTENVMIMGQGVACPPLCSTCNLDVGNQKLSITLSTNFTDRIDAISIVPTTTSGPQAPILRPGWPAAGSTPQTFIEPGIPCSTQSAKLRIRYQGHELETDLNVSNNPPCGI